MKLCFLSSYKQHVHVKLHVTKIRVHKIMCQPSAVIPYYSNFTCHVCIVDCTFPYLAAEVLAAIATTLLTQNSPQELSP